MWTSICAALALAPSVYAVPAFRALEPRDADPLKVLTEERLAKRDGHIVNLIQEEYNLPSVEVTVGGQTLTLSMSAATSDIWVASKKFQCMTTPNEGSINKPLDYCALQELYHSDQFSGGQIDGVNFNVSYAGGGPHQVGRVGYEPVTVAGVTVQKQAIAIVDSGSWFSPSSGGFGIGNPLGGGYVYKGNDPSQDTLDGRYPVPPPWYWTAIQQKLFAPIISHTFDIGPKIGEVYGKLAFGGIPDVAHDNKWAITPILKAEPGDIKVPLPESTLEKVPNRDYAYYKIRMDSITVNGKALSTNNKNFQVEPSSQFTELPPEILASIAAGFDPPFTANPDTDGFPWIGDCNAKTPTVSFDIGGVKLQWNNQSLLYKQSDGSCILNLLNDYPDFPATLGQTFLNQLVTVYDIGQHQMRFAKRT